MMHPRVALSIYILATLLIVTSCRTQETIAVDVAPHPAAQAPDFQVALVDGTTFSLSALRGRPLVLNFWATWCTPCRREMPLLQALHDESSEEGLSVLAVNYGEDLATVAQFVNEDGYTFPIALDPDMELARTYLVQGMPTTLFIDRDGVIQQIHMGEMNADLLRDYQTLVTSR